MTVKALYDYDYPSRDRQELFGEDILVNVLWWDTMMLVSPACFRVPRTMTWSDFRTGMIDPWAASDPGYDPAAAGGWTVDGRDFRPEDDMTLADVAVAHKGLITFHA